MLRHPDHSVAPVEPAGLTVVWADAEQARSAADAIEQSLSWEMPSLYAVGMDGAATAPSFALVRITDDLEAAEDWALNDLASRLERARAAVPARLAQLSEAMAETTEAVDAADRRCHQLKAVLRQHAPTLAGVADARSIVGLERRIASLELDRRGLDVVDVAPIAKAYESLLDLDRANLDGANLPVEPEAERLAAAWDHLTADEADLDQSEPRHPLTDQMLTLQSKLRLAEHALAVAQTDLARRRPTDSDRAELEQLHAAVEEASERLDGSGGRRASRGAHDRAVAAEAACLRSFGFDSYPDFIITGAIDPPIAALARFQEAEQGVRAVEVMMSDLLDHMAPSAARQRLLARADEVAAEIASIFGDLDAGDDVAAALRNIRRPPPEWFELIDALHGAGHDPTGDPMSVAYQVLVDAQERNGPRDAIEAEIVRLRDRLASIDPTARAQFGPLGAAAAELVYVEYAQRRLAADGTEIRAGVTEELAQDPSARVTLATMQALDQELSQWAARLDDQGRGEGGGDGADGPCHPLPVPLVPLAMRIDSALAEIELGVGQPLILVFDLEPEDEAESDGEPDAESGDALMADCVGYLIALADDRQVIVITSLDAMIHAADDDGRPALSTFAPAS